jgi:hypothetical protein
VPEPQWKTELSRDLVLRGFLAETEEERLAVVMPHIEAAYQRGLIAGRSQAGYGTRRKRKEEACTTDGAGAAGPSPASNTEDG